MERYLMTHSLLSSWLYSLKENPFEDATSERDSYAEFLSTLNREPSLPNEAMQKGIDFENLVTDIADGKGDASHRWYEAAGKVAHTLRGAKFQFRTRCEFTVGDLLLLFYGRLDALEAGKIYDIKYSGKYDVGKFYDSTQHPFYFALVPEATEFRYLVSDGTNVWTESYLRENTQSIIPTVEDFLEWLKVHDLMHVYKEKWLAL